MTTKKELGHKSSVATVPCKRKPSLLYNENPINFTYQSLKFILSISFYLHLLYLYIATYIYFRSILIFIIIIGCFHFASIIVNHRRPGPPTNHNIVAP